MQFWVCCTCIDIQKDEIGAIRYIKKYMKLFHDIFREQLTTVDTQGQFQMFCIAVSFFMFLKAFLMFCCPLSSNLSLSLRESATWLLQKHVPSYKQQQQASSFRMKIKWWKSLFVLWTFFFTECLEGIYIATCITYLALFFYQNRYIRFLMDIWDKCFEFWHSDTDFTFLEVVEEIITRA